MGASQDKGEKQGKIEEEKRRELLLNVEKERERIKKEFEAEYKKMLEEVEKERKRIKKEFETKLNEILSVIESGDESAKTKLAWYKLSGLEGVKVDADEAVKLLEERVAAGDSEAMWMLGLCKEYGRGTKQDIEEAKKLYKQSDKSGNEIGKILAVKGWHGRGSGKMKIGSLRNNKKERIAMTTIYNELYF